MQRSAVGVCWILLAAAPALAAPPTLTGISPRGLQRGKTTTLRLSGNGIGLAEPELLSRVPGTLGKPQVVEQNQIKVDVTLPADAPVGFYPIRVRTADGLTGSELVAVDDLPETAEKEPNDELEQAQELALPVTVSAACGGTDRDHYKFSARKGEPVVIELEARRMGSGLDPAIRLLDASGREVADETDASHIGGDLRLVVPIPDDGTYTIVVNDIRFAGGGDPFYRLKLGAFVSAEAIFPLGWKRGESVEVTFLGGNLPAPLRTKINTPADSNTAWMPVVLPASPAGESPFRLVLGDAPEMLEPEDGQVHAWQAGTVMNGRISAPGEVDQYKLAVTPGQALVFDLDAGQLGSHLDAVMRLVKPDGAILAETDDSQGLDPQLTFTAPADVKEIVVKVEDLLGRGGPGFSYRLKAQPVKTEFTLLVASPAITIPQGATVNVPVNVARQNFNDAIQLSIPNTLEGITATGGLIPAGANQGTLVLTAAPGTATRTIDLEIWGQGGPAAQPMRRRARLAGDGTPQPLTQPFELAAAIGNGPPITLAASAKSVTLVHGEKTQLVVKANRPANQKQPISIATAGLPRQVAGGGVSLAGDKNEATIEFDVDSLAPLGPAVLMITGKMRANNRDETISLPPINARVVRPYSFEVLSPDITIPQGGKATVIGVIRRVSPFKGQVKVAMEGSSPAHVSVGSTTVEPNAALVQIEVSAGKEAKPDSFEILLRASTHMEGRKQTKDYIIPDVKVRVTVTAARSEPVAAK